MTFLEDIQESDDDFSIEYYVDINDSSLDPAYEQDAAAISFLEQEIRLIELIERLQSPVLMDQRYEKKLSSHR